MISTVKAVLTIIVFVVLLLALALVSVFTRRPEAVVVCDDDE